MDARIKKLWVEALRSGEFTQGTNRLRTPNGRYCCLGVLCEVAIREGYSMEPLTPDLEWWDRSAPNYEIADWAGLHQDFSDLVMIADEIAPLMFHNDGGTRGGITIAPKTFAQIADAIEEQL